MIRDAFDASCNLFLSAAMLERHNIFHRGMKNGCSLPNENTFANMLQAVAACDVSIFVYVLLLPFADVANYH